VLGDFPLARGLPPLQVVKGGSGDGSPPTATAGRRRGQLAEELCCIVFVGDLSVTFPNQCIFFLPAKKTDRRESFDLLLELLLFKRTRAFRS
jgi:hypothetical protein